jgi:predicted membrane-bound spermidine synthase
MTELQPLMVYLLFFCSGLSGLIYQVVWVRAFGNVFGNTIHSASLVIAVFMLRLGAGSYGVGMWPDRRYSRRPESLLRAFGAFELAMRLIRFRGHRPKGGYDVQTDGRHFQAPAAPEIR